MAIEPTRYRKVSITLPEALLANADNRAQRAGTSRSQVIAGALTALIQAEEQELAAEGYRFYAAEAEEFAAATASSAAEIMLAEQWLEHKTNSGLT